MKTLTVRDYQLTPIDNLFMGILVKHYSSINFLKQKPTIAIIIDNEYIDAFTGQVINFSTDKLLEIEAFGDYYNSNEYCFIENSGKISISLYSLEPFKRYSKKALNNLK